MSEPRAAHENPYWSEYTKPHVFDPIEIGELCLIGFNTIQATRNLSVLWNAKELEGDTTPHWQYPLLISHHQNAAEENLSGILLKLAVAYRALDDEHSENKAFKEFQEVQLREFGSFLTVYSENKIRDSLREVCNKIIHANDIRIVYDDNDEDNEKRIWHMTNTVEMKGALRKQEWSISIQILNFFEAMLETVNFFYE